MAEAIDEDGRDHGDEQPETGWRVVAENPSLVRMVDGLLSLPPRREFNKSELAEITGVSRRSVHTHLDTLRQLGVVEAVPDTSPARFRFDRDSDVSRALIELDAAVNRNGPNAE
ncbi:winged helix-turn-helix domain-containing protein [Halobaculum sp. MBLA0147]|uniref:helix-turn-helix domain-containing protein n=1 Tax=Halobaculum sp. MBLA0147 TaxID=3079934 RepID=UPI0035249E13